MYGTLKQTRPERRCTGVGPNLPQSRSVISWFKVLAGDRVVDSSPMILHAQARRPALMSERRLITRVITVIALGALLLLGLAALSHDDDAQTGGMTAASAISAPHDVAAQPSVPVLEADPDIASSGMALCVLGVVCSFVLYLVVHLLLRRERVTLALWRSLPPLFIKAATNRRTGHAHTIAQLGISRT